MIAKNAMVGRSARRVAMMIVALSLAAPVAQAGTSRKPGTSKRAQARAAELRAEALRAALAEAQAVREREVAAIQPLLASGLHERAASRLLAAALTHEDAMLHLEPAEQFLAAADRTHAEAIDRGLASVAAARELLGEVVDPTVEWEVDLRTVRVAHEDAEGLRERADATQRRLEARREALRVQRRGRQEMAAGASLLAVGVAGAAVLASGVVYRTARSRELAAITGHEAECDLRAEHGRRWAHLQVAPTLGGLVLSGRF